MAMNNTENTQFQDIVIAGTIYSSDNLPIPISKPVGSRFRDRTSDVIHGVTILYPIGHSKDGRIMWLCKCHCGTFFSALPTRLDSGNTKSCGCVKRATLAAYNQSKRIDLTGRRFGKLTVLGSAGIRQLNWGSLEFWNCRCDCGTIKDINGADLKQGKIISCGCIRSKKEEEIKLILKNKKLSYQQQYSFVDLFYKTPAQPLRFDFAIFQRNQIYLIEYQGTQHFDKDNPWYSEENVERDDMKKEYCILNGIPLLRLTEADNLESSINNFLMGVDAE